MNGFQSGGTRRGYTSYGSLGEEAEQGALVLVVEQRSQHVGHRWRAPSPRCRGGARARTLHTVSEPALDALRARMHELKDLAGVLGLMSWDQETYLPSKAGPARAAQLATLQGLYHQRLVAPEVGDWLERAERIELGRRDPGDAEGLPPRARPLGPGSRVAGPGAGRGPVHGPRGLARGPHRARLRPVRPRPAAAARAPARAGRRRRARRGALRRAARPLRAGDDHRPAPARARAAARVAGPAGGRPRRGARRAGDLRRPPLRRRAPVAVHARAAGTPGVRPARRTAGPEHPPLHRRDPPHRRAAHDAHRPGKPVPRALRHAARVRARAVRAGLRRRAPPHAARRRPVDGPARVAVAALGEPGGPQPAVLGLPVPAAPVGVPRGAGGRGARGLSPRHQPGAALAHPGRGGRDHLQPAHRAPHRAGGAAAP